MESVKTITILMLYGMKDCVNGIYALKILWDRQNAAEDQQPRRIGKKNVIDVLKNCVVFGTLFWLSRFSFRFLIIGKCLNYMMTFLDHGDLRYVSWLVGSLTVFFEMLWTIPLFFLSRLLTFKWYQEISELTYMKTFGKPTGNYSISIAWGDQITSTAIQCIFFIQGYLIFFCPVPEALKHVISTLHLSLLYSLYAFEYKWVQMGWQMNKRIAYLETKWPYFVGFGLPLALLTSYIGSYVESMCIFSTFFPLYVISSTVTFNSQTQTFSQPLRLFTLAKILTDFLECYICRRIQR